jgi:peroxiredoxin
MNRLWIWSLSLLIIGFCYSCGDRDNTQLAADAFRLEVQVVNANEGQLYLLREMEGELVAIDSANIKKGLASLGGQLSSPEMFYLQVNSSDDYEKVFVEKGVIQVNLDVLHPDDMQVTGSGVHTLFTNALDVIHPFEEELNHLFELFKNPKITLNAEVNDSISRSADAIYARQNAAIKDWVEKHMDSPVAAYMVNRYLIYDADYNQILQWSIEFEKNVADNKYTHMLVTRRDILSHSAAGQQAPDFSLPDPDGDLLQLSSLRGKVVLIDFWASWCGPCRQENPKVVKLYEELQGTNFEILGVSFDSNRDQWLEAIAYDKLPWLQVSDLKGWKSSAGELYGINSIPHTVLVDTNGVVLGHNIKLEELRSLLQEIL